MLLFSFLHGPTKHTYTLAWDTKMPTQKLFANFASKRCITSLNSQPGVDRGNELKSILCTYHWLSPGSTSMLFFQAFAQLSPLNKTDKTDYSVMYNNGQNYASKYPFKKNDRKSNVCSAQFITDDATDQTTHC